MKKAKILSLGAISMALLAVPTATTISYSTPVAYDLSSEYEGVTTTFDLPSYEVELQGDLADLAVTFEETVALAEQDNSTLYDIGYTVATDADGIVSADFTLSFEVPAEFVETNDSFKVQYKVMEGSTQVGSSITFTADAVELGTTGKKYAKITLGGSDFDNPTNGVTLEANTEYKIEIGLNADENAQPTDTFTSIGSFTFTTPDLNNTYTYSNITEQVYYDGADNNGKYEIGNSGSFIVMDVNHNYVSADTQLEESLVKSIYNLSTSDADANETTPQTSEFTMIFDIKLPETVATSTDLEYSARMILSDDTGTEIGTYTLATTPAYLNSNDEVVGTLTISSLLLIGQTFDANTEYSIEIEATADNVANGSSTWTSLGTVTLNTPEENTAVFYEQEISEMILSGQGGSGMGAGAIAGIVIGSIAGAALIGGVGYYWYKHSKSTKTPKTTK